MPQAEAEIRSEITAHIEKRGGPLRSWFVGVASDPRRQLFDRHKVLREQDAWIYRTCATPRGAQRVQDYFLKAVGTDGATEITDSSMTAVYAYRKNPHTAP